MLQLDVLSLQMVRWAFTFLGLVLIAAVAIYLAMRISRLIWRQRIKAEHRNGVLLQILLPKQAHSSDIKVP